MLTSRAVVEPFSLVLVMEERHRLMLREAFPDLSDRIYLLTEMIGRMEDVHDPIGTVIANYRTMGKRSIRPFLRASIEFASLRKMRSTNQTPRGYNPTPSFRI